mgnify:FL=1
MTTLYQDIKDKLARLHVLEQLIIINTVVFLLNGLLSLLIPNGRFYILDFLSLSNDFWAVLVYPWTLLTYGFLHHSFSHLFFNMLVLYFLAQTFSNLYSPRMALKIYLLGVFSGAVFFSITSAFVPSLLNINAPLVGASAGVRACIIFLCVYMPNKIVGIFNFRFKLKYLGIAMVVLDLPGLLSENSGGTIAHIGGYVLGYFYANQLQKGREIGGFLDKILDYLSAKQPLKTVYKNRQKKYTSSTQKNRSDFTHQKQIDLILDKISKSGYESLSKQEKDFLFRAGKK